MFSEGLLMVIAVIAVIAVVAFVCRVGSPEGSDTRRAQENDHGDDGHVG